MVGGAGCQLRRMLLPLAKASLLSSGVSRGCLGLRTLPRSLSDRPVILFAVVVVGVAGAAGVVKLPPRRRCSGVGDVGVDDGAVAALLRLRSDGDGDGDDTVRSIDCVVGGRRWRGARSVGASVLVVDATPTATPTPAEPPLPRCRVAVFVVVFVAVVRATAASRRAITIKCKVNDAICYKIKRKILFIDFYN